MFWNFCVGIHRYSALTYGVIESYIILHWKQVFLGDKMIYKDSQSPVLQMN